VLKAEGLFVGTVDGLSDAMHETAERVMNHVTQSTTRKNCYITESGSFDALCVNFIDAMVQGSFLTTGLLEVYGRLKLYSNS
jgi:hypothetical protein